MIIVCCLAFFFAFAATAEFNANFSFCQLLLLFKQRYFRWNPLQIASLIFFSSPEMDLYNYCYYYTMIVMAIQNSDDFISQTVNAPEKKSQASQCNRFSRCVAFQCPILMKFYSFSFLLFQAPNYIKITASYRHRNDLCDECWKGAQTKSKER